MILMKLRRSLLRMLLRCICRRAVICLLSYCRRAGWTEKEIHNVRRALNALLHILLRFLRKRYIQRNATAAFSPGYASC